MREPKWYRRQCRTFSENSGTSKPRKLPPDRGGHQDLLVASERLSATFAARGQLVDQKSLPNVNKRQVNVHE